MISFILSIFSHTVEVLNRWPTVGVAHTGCVIVDIHANTLVPHHRLVDTQHPIAVESGVQFLERSMKSGWTVCFPSATFRREALVGGGGLRPEDGTIDDIPLLMRIATEWDFAYLNLPLAIITAHVEASSASLGSFTANGFRGSRSLPDMLYERRRRFLAEADLTEVEAGRLARIAEKMYQRDVLAPFNARQYRRWSKGDLQGTRQGNPAGSWPGAGSADRALRHGPARGSLGPRRRATTAIRYSAPWISARTAAISSLVAALVRVHEPSREAGAR